MNYTVIAASIKKTIIGRNTKSIIAALLLAVNSAFAQVPSYVPTNGLVGWWPFNGNANDESGNGNNGAVNGAVLVSDRNGIVNAAYSFDGINDFILSNNFNLIQGNVSRTFSFWIKYSNVDAGGWIISYGPQAVNFPCNDEYHIEAKMVADCNFPGIGVSVPCAQKRFEFLLNDNVWRNFTIVYDGTGLANTKLYVNGVLHTDNYCNDNVGIAAQLATNVTSGGISFGKRNDNLGFLDGSLDDIAIWNRALTQQEITALYNAQTCNSTSNTITADGPTTFCAGNSVNLSSDVVGGTYQWKKNGVNITTNGTSRTYKATATGSYTCVATCNGTALTSNAITITSKTNAFASVSASGATSFCAGDSVTLNCTNLGSNYSVQWYRTNISMENATAYSQVVTQPGTYKVVTKNLTTGCSRISGSSVVVAVNCRLANPDVIAADITESDFAAKGINEEPKGKIYIYPNPTSDNKFTVELMGLELDGAATLEVYNAMGQILSSEKVNITNGTLNRTIQIDEQSKGQLCLVRLIAGSEVYDSKVILK